MTLRDGLAYRRSTFETRAADDTIGFSGYATGYGYEYEVLGGPEHGGWIEVVAPGAATETLRRSPDVRLLVNHEGVPLARTSRGTMTLREDENGLRVDVPELDMRSPLVQTIESAMRRGDMDEMSFAFRVLGQEWNEDYTHRTITKIDLAVKGSDVSIVTYPANDATIATIRSEANIDELRNAVAAKGMDVRMARAIVDRLVSSNS